MRAILRNRKSGLYYASCNQWVSDPAWALDFEDIEDPGQLNSEEGVTELEVVLICEESGWELALPVRLEWHRGQRARVAA